MGFYPVAFVQSYSTTVRQTRTNYTITQNNTNTQHKIHRTIKDQMQQWRACANNEDTLLLMNKMRKIVQLQLLSKWAHYSLKSVFTMSFPSFHFPALTYQQSCYHFLPYTSLHFTSLITFVTLFLKLFKLQEVVSRTSAGSLFLELGCPVYKAIFSDIRLLLSAPNFSIMIDIPSNTEVRLRNVYRYVIIRN
jgi:hypothetical protein